MHKFLLKIRKALIIALLISLAFVAALFLWVGDKISSRAEMVLERVSIGMPSDEVTFVAFLIVLALTVPITMAMLKFWKNKWAIIGLAFGYATLSVLFYHFTEDEMLGEEREARYICPPRTPNELPSISRTVKNKKGKGSCSIIETPEEVATAVEILAMKKRGENVVAPREVELEKILSNRFELFRNGVQWIYSSKYTDENGLRVLYYGPGFDNRVGGMLIAATNGHVKSIRDHYKQLEQKRGEELLRKKLESESSMAQQKQSTKEEEKETAKKALQDQYVDLVTRMNVEARKLQSGILSESDAKTAKELHINLSGDLDKLKHKLDKKDWPNIRVEPMQKPREEKPVTTRTNLSPDTSTTTEEKYALIFRFIERDPKEARFNFANGLHGNRVLIGTKGVYLSSTGEACNTATISIDDGPFVSICTYHKNPVKMTGGTVYKINNTGGLIFSRNFRE